MAKVVLHLSITPELLELAKSSGLNLSAEFEEWLRIRMNQFDNSKPVVDIDMEIAKHQSEIQKLKSQKELEQDKQDLEALKLETIDNIINNMEEFRDNKKWEDLVNDSKYGIDTRTHGLQFLFQKRFKIVLNPLEAKELIMQRIKERGFIGSDN